ncbi:MAG: class I SAM-dependent methyltransferase [Casimicrobiaceae bacterium]
MSLRSLLPEAVEDYIHRVATRETPLQKRLREETANLPGAGMQIGADLGALLALLIQLTGARRTVEIGTFTGYSALAVAMALPPEGTITCCDINEEWTQIARRYWSEAGVGDRVYLRLAPALETLRDLQRDPGPGSFDFAFIDADKTGYDGYYEACLTLLRPGGLIAFDNTLWGGAVADPARNDPDTAALRALNIKVRDDSRVTSCLISIGDGVLLARKH